MIVKRNGRDVIKYVADFEARFFYCVGDSDAGPDLQCVAYKILEEYDYMYECDYILFEELHCIFDKDRFIVWEKSVQIGEEGDNDA